MRFSLNLFFVIIFFLTALYAYGDEEKNSEPCFEKSGHLGEYVLQDGRIFHRSCRIEEIETEGQVKSLFLNQGKAFFVAFSSGFADAGIIDGDSVKTYRIPLQDLPAHIRGLRVEGGRFFFIASPEGGDPNSRKTAGRLIRFDPDRGAAESVSGVMDFRIIDGRILLLKEGVLDYNGLQIPLFGSGEGAIVRVLGGRIVLVRSGIYTEVCDLKTGAGVYQFGETAAYGAPEGCNLMIEFIDLLPEKIQAGNDSELIYYRVMVNGREEGRTETGPPSVYKRICVRAKEGNYNILSMERWRLDRTRGRYERLNNISQPEPVRIYFPQGKFVKISVALEEEGYVVRRRLLEIRKEAR